MARMSRLPRNPRRASDRDGREIPPMTLATMRAHGVHSIASHLPASRPEVSYFAD